MFEWMHIEACEKYTSYFCVDKLWKDCLPLYKMLPLKDNDKIRYLHIWPVSWPLISSQVLCSASLLQSLFTSAYILIFF